MRTGTALLILGAVALYVWSKRTAPMAAARAQLTGAQAANATGSTVAGAAKVATDTAASLAKTATGLLDAISSFGSSEDSYEPQSGGNDVSAVDYSTAI